MADISCRLCDHFEPHPKADQSKDHRGRCRRFPPLADVGHPLVHTNDYCGEFKPKEK